MISVIIATHNRKDLLKRCLDSVRGQGLRDAETIVVDNASADGSVEMVATYYSGVRLIRNTRNLLFCKAYNQGIDAAKGSFVLCLNNDAVLHKDYLKEALFAIGSDNKIGMVSGKILRMDKTTIDSTGLFLGRNRKPIERGYGKKDTGQYEEPGYVFGVCGAATFFRKSMLNGLKDEHGYFDERFGMYYEDLDICWRAQNKGWKAYYTPKAIAYHVRGGTAVLRPCHCEPRTKCFSSLLEENLVRGERPKQSLFLRLLRALRALAMTLVSGPRNDMVRYLSDDLKKRYIKNRYLCMRKNDTLCNIFLHLPFIILYELKIWGYLVLDSAFGLARTIFPRVEKNLLDRKTKI